MHARIDQLLSIRDGEPVDAGIAQHVPACTRCAAELRRLVRQGEALRRLPQHAAPDVWSRLGERARSQGRLQKWTAVAAVLVLGVIATIAYREEPHDVAGRASVAATGMADEQFSSLLARSHALERALQSLPQRTAVERAGTAATIDGLEQRIQWLDHHLNHADDAGLDDRQTAHLWQERVALLDTLVKVRYAESGTYVF